MSDALQKIYGDSCDNVRTHGLDEASALSHYHKYVAFVLHFGPEAGTLLDIGCGTGWSTYLFGRKGFRATGVDLNPAAFEPPELPNLQLIAGSALDLPIPDASFDIVTSYQLIEHVPNPERALMEMLRVTKPGGLLLIAGPNLLSPWHSVLALTHYVWKNRPLSTIWLRGPGLPRQPFGNTVPEILAIFGINIVRIIRKLAARRATFTMRQPDLRPPFHADNDACYLCNPIDLEKFLDNQGCQVIQNGYPGRMKGTALLAGGTWVVARTPDLYPSPCL